MNSCRGSHQINLSSNQLSSLTVWQSIDIFDRISFFLWLGANTEGERCVFAFLSFLLFSFTHFSTGRQFIYYNNKIPCFCASATISSFQREDWTSPICALRRKNIQIRDCPIPPPIVRGSSLSKIDFWKGSAARSGQPAFSSWDSSELSSTRMPIEESSKAMSKIGRASCRERVSS